MTDLATGRGGAGGREAAVSPPELERYRTELTGYCYRMLGLGLRGRGRRAGDDGPGMAGPRPLRGPGEPAVVAVPHRHERLLRPAQRAVSGGPSRWTWGRPATGDAAAGRAAPGGDLGRADPGRPGACPPTATRPSEAAARESIRLAFVAALQHLPPRQRAVLILREVLRVAGDRGGRAARHVGRVGQQRAAAGPRHPRRRTRRRRRGGGRADGLDEEQRALVARYVDAFERYDIAALVALLHDDATVSMPPLRDVAAGPRRHRPVDGGTGQRLPGSRLVPVEANGVPSFAPVPGGRAGVAGSRSRCTSWRSSGDRISGITFFLDTGLFAAVRAARPPRGVTRRAAPRPARAGRAATAGRPSPAVV